MSFLMEVLGEQKNLCRESYREIPPKAVARPPHGKTIRAPVRALDRQAT
jgi:hypothetical protein